MKTTIFRMVMPEVRGKSPMHKTGAHSYSTRKPGAALAQTPNRLGGIVARGALRVGTTGDYKPFSFRAGKTGEFIGLDIQFAGDLARALGSLDAGGKTGGGRVDGGSAAVEAGTVRDGKFNRLWPNKVPWAILEHTVLRVIMASGTSGCT